MGYRLATAATVVSMAFAGAASAQPAAPPAPPPLAVPNPTYVSLVLQIDVNRPAAAAWARVGKYCDIAEWMPAPCTITAGQDGQLGAVRRLNLRGGVIEILVAKTDLSYTYTQPVRVGAPFNAYHGTLEARPLTATTSRLVYSFVYDNSMLADEAARAAEIADRRSRFNATLQNMKTLAEGGTLPPPAAPAPVR